MYTIYYSDFFRILKRCVDDCLARVLISETDFPLSFASIPSLVTQKTPPPTSVAMFYQVQVYTKL